jgi:serine/threonine protein kinase
MKMKKNKKIIGKITGKEYDLAPDEFEKGGTAKIYRATIGTDKFVVKIPNNTNEDSGGCKDRVDNEITVFTDHNELVDYYVENAVWDNADSVPCFIMKDITQNGGEFLNTFLQANTIFSKKEISIPETNKLDVLLATHILEEATRKLEIIHNADICHLDIIPRNMSFSHRNGSVKITDFGNARKVGTPLKYLYNDSIPSSSSPGYGYSASENKPYQNEIFSPPEIRPEETIMLPAATNMDVYMLMETFSLMTTGQITRSWNEINKKTHSPLEELMLPNFKRNKYLSESNYQEILTLILTGTALDPKERYDNGAELLDAIQELDLSPRSHVGLKDVMPHKFYVPDFSFQSHANSLKREANKTRSFFFGSKRSEVKPVVKKKSPTKDLTKDLEDEDWSIPGELSEEYSPIDYAPKETSTKEIQEVSKLKKASQPISTPKYILSKKKPNKVSDFFSRHKKKLLVAATVVGLSLGAYYAGSQAVKCYKEYEKSTIEALQTERELRRTTIKQKLRRPSKKRTTPHSTNYNPIVIEADLSEDCISPGERIINSSSGDNLNATSLEKKLHQNTDNLEICIDQNEIERKVEEAFETDLNDVICQLLNGAVDKEGILIEEVNEKENEKDDQKVAAKKYLKFKGEKSFQFNEDTKKVISLGKLFTSNFRGKRKYKIISKSDDFRKCEIKGNKLTIKGNKDYYSFPGDLENVVIEATQGDLKEQASFRIKIKPVNDLPVATEDGFSKLYLPAFYNKDYRTFATVNIDGHFTDVDVDDNGKLKYLITLGKDHSTAKEIANGKSVTLGEGKDGVKVTLEDNVLTIYSSKNVKNGSLKIIATDKHGTLDKMPSKNINFSFYGPKRPHCSFVDNANEKYVITATALNQGLAEYMGFDNLDSCLEHNYPNLSDIANSVCVSAEIFQKREQVKPFNNGKVNLIINSEGKVIMDNFDMNKEYVTRFEEIFENTIMKAKVSTTGFENTCLRLVIKNQYTENTKDVSKKSVELEEKKSEENKKRKESINNESDVMDVCNESLNFDSYAVKCVEIGANQKTIEACGGSLDFDSYRIECIKTKANPNIIEACGESLDFDSYKVECIKTRANPNTIEACGESLDFDSYRVECMEIGAGEDLISKCKDTYSSDLKIVQCIKENKVKDL